MGEAEHGASGSFSDGVGEAEHGASGSFSDGVGDAEHGLFKCNVRNKQFVFTRIFSLHHTYFRFELIDHKPS